jgi:hypothetical protein
MQTTEGEFKPLALSVVVYCRGLGMVRGRTRNLGIGGMVLDTGVVRLPQDEEVELAFMLDGADSDAELHQLTAQVVRTSDRGTELVFTDFEPSTMRLLRRALDGDSRRAPPSARRPSRGPSRAETAVV